MIPRRTGAWSAGVFPYEPPVQPCLRIDTTATTPEQAATLVLAALARRLS